MSDLKREIGFHKNHFKEFYDKQPLAVRKKIDWMVVKRMRVVPKKYLKHLSNTNGLWDIRVSAGNGIFRIFCFFDKGNLVVLYLGFKRKHKKHRKKK